MCSQIKKLPGVFCCTQWARFPGWVNNLLTLDFHFICLVDLYRMIFLEAVYTVTERLEL